MKGMERGLPCMQQSFSMSINIAVAFFNLHAPSKLGDSGGQRFYIKNLREKSEVWRISRTTPLTFIDNDSVC